MSVHFQISFKFYQLNHDNRISLLDCGNLKFHEIGAIHEMSKILYLL